ncbi:MAG TPA: hypothetical protein VIG57_11865 [Candidatus Entotheonella sp.]|jgi:hypothetical protein
MPRDNLPIDLLDVPDGVYGDIEAFMACFEGPAVHPDYPTPEHLQSLLEAPLPSAELVKEEEEEDIS